MDVKPSSNNSNYNIIEQMRSFSGGTMLKRCQLGPNSTSANVPAGTGADDFFFKLYFQVMPLP